MAVTLADVAARAGVSSATVSRVLSGDYPVAGTTRSRVLRAVAELEYVVDGPASALAAASSDLLGILVNDIADPFFGIVAGAVQGELDSGTDDQVPRRLAVVCNTGGSPERELTYLTLLQRQRAAAIVLTGGAVEDPAHRASLAARLSRLAAGGTRIVLCGRPPLDPLEPDATAMPGPDAEAAAIPGPDCEPDARPVAAARGRSARRAARGAVLTVAFDNRGGAHALTAHLLALGHRHIGYVAGPSERTTTRHRLAGHRAALAAHGAAGPDRAERLTVHAGGYDRSCGYRGAVELLRRAPETTAVLAANDTVALGVCAALRDAGLRVPQDVSVAGFDDLPFSADAAPGLTTVRLPLQEAGAVAGQLALGTRPAPPGGTTTMPHALVVRASTAVPRAGA
ncbi:LacI family transcriptional regulator [Streptomyces qinglanensis]|uniref:LacI family transcriptional regulator n=1 Tax=Streptomyces qinglanensis TaxID=943816 RepID=A0A1E7K1E4_9ACTN|nr:LacI family DNA-binding transcriptional regulator [Streptomyces qinglanensis]OEU97675.1 LacI family transcriptional regulator [Streptomyces qinglanensis]